MVSVAFLALPFVVEHTADQGTEYLILASDAGVF